MHMAPLFTCLRVWAADCVHHGGERVDAARAEAIPADLEGVHVQHVDRHVDVVRRDVIVGHRSILDVRWVLSTGLS